MIPQSRSSKTRSKSDTSDIPVLLEKRKVAPGPLSARRRVTGVGKRRNHNCNSVAFATPLNPMIDAPQSAPRSAVPHAELADYQASVIVHDVEIFGHIWRYCLAGDGADTVLLLHRGGGGHKLDMSQCAFTAVDLNRFCSRLLGF